MLIRVAIVAPGVTVRLIADSLAFVIETVNDIVVDVGVDDVIGVIVWVQELPSTLIAVVVSKD